MASKVKWINNHVVYDLLTREVALHESQFFFPQENGVEKQ